MIIIPAATVADVPINLRREIFVSFFEAFFLVGFMVLILSYCHFT
jgi:hypothetical protein